MMHTNANPASEEKIFNLQLLIQRQEEELRLYRNGTSAQELLDLIREKDIEIETWRTKLEEKEEKLKKLAKTSGDVLLKYEHLQNELQTLHQAKQSLEMDYKELFEAKTQAEERCQVMKDEMTQLRQHLQGQENQIGALSLEIWDQKQKLADFQSHSTTVQISLLESNTEVKHLKDYQKDLEALVGDLNLENASLKSQLAHSKKILEDQDEAVGKLQKRCALLVSEKSETMKKVDLERGEMLAHVQQFRESMSVNLSQRDEALKKREEKIRDLQFQVQVLQQEVKILKTGPGAAGAGAGAGGEAGEKREKRVLGERTNTLLGEKREGGKKAGGVGGVKGEEGQENLKERASAVL